MKRVEVVDLLVAAGVRCKGTQTLRQYEGGWGRPGPQFRAAWETALGLQPRDAAQPAEPDEDPGDDAEPRAA